MSKYWLKKMSYEENSCMVDIHCRLDSLADMNELINDLVVMKNRAFPSQAEEHKKAMEVLNVKSKRSRTKKKKPPKDLSYYF